MRNILRKNQVIIAALAVMIMVAGYLTFTKDDTLNNDSIQTSNQDKDVADASQDPVLQNDDDDDVLDADELELDGNDDVTNVDDKNEVTTGDEDDETEVGETEVGDAVLASNPIALEYFNSAKLNREQVRAKNKETLEEILNNDSISDDQKNKALETMVRMTEVADMENAAEMLLMAKGFPNVVVNVTDESVDVVVGVTSLTEQQVAQIEDIVKRKTGISVQHITINPVPLKSVEAEDDTKLTEDDSKDDKADSKEDAKETESDNAKETESDNTKTAAPTEEKKEN